MKQQEVFNKIGGIIKELNEQYKYLEANPDDMNSLELELFVANAHFLWDHAEILNKINLQQAARMAPIATTVLPITPEEKFFEPVVRQQDKSLPAGNTAADEQREVNFQLLPAVESPAAQPDEPEIIRHELDLGDDFDWEDDETFDDGPDDSINEEPTEPVDEELITTPEVAAEEEEQPLTELVATEEDLLPAIVVKPITELITQKDEEKLTINQRIAVQMNKGGVADKPAGLPITDLKHAISLNDKLLFVKDLFNGYSLAYSEAIEILNRFESFDDAERFLSKNYIAKNNWEAKPDTTERFYGLLKRRYAS